MEKSTDNFLDILVLPFETADDVMSDFILWSLVCKIIKAESERTGCSMDKLIEFYKKGFEAGCLFLRVNDKIRNLEDEHKRVQQSPAICRDTYLFEHVMRSIETGAELDAA